MARLKQLVLLAVCVCSVLVAANAADKSAANLTYHEIGADWPGLCQTGKFQSPIDVVSKDFVPFDAPNDMIRINSLGVVTGMKVFVTTVLPHVEFVWDSYVVEPNVTVPANKDGDVFAPLTDDMDPEDIHHVAAEAAQCHFHTPSESSLNGKLHEGVLHCVHFVKEGESQYCDDIKADGGLGCPVVVSIFLTANSTDTPFDTILGAKPNVSENAEEDSQVFEPLVTAMGKKNSVEVEGDLDLDSFLPLSGAYATWEGSLTTAPCTEGVLWVKLLEPLAVSEEQIEHLKDTVGLAAGEDCEAIVDGHCSPPRPTFNNREHQKLHGRVLRSGFAF